MEKTEYYKELIPREIRNAFKSLDNDLAWALFPYLCIKDRVTFSQLMKEFNLDSPKLSYQLRKLQKGGLIEGYFEKEPHKRAYSYYTLSHMGHSFFDFIYVLAKEPIETDIRIDGEFNSKAIGKGKFIGEMKIYEGPGELYVSEITKLDAIFTLKRKKESISDSDASIINLNW